MLRILLFLNKLSNKKNIIFLLKCVQYKKRDLHDFLGGQNLTHPTTELLSSMSIVVEIPSIDQKS